MVDTALIPGRQPFNTLGCLPVPVLLVIESVAQEFPAFFLDDGILAGSDVAVARFAELLRSEFAVHQTLGGVSHGQASAARK